MVRGIPFLLFITIICGQNYSANVYGLPMAKIQFKSIADSVILKFETIGLIDAIWPAKNSYTTYFDSTHFGLITFKKKIKQDNLKQSVLIKLKNEVLQYNNQTRDRSDSTQTMFTMFARLNQQHQEDLDTKWFEIDHEGKPMRGRFLWGETETIKVNNTNILCDHIRMDMEYLDESNGFLERTDRLMHYAPDPDAVRQIWVERNGNRRIIQVSMTAYGFPFNFVIQNE
jgi:hypothetical protein